MNESHNYRELAERRLRGDTELAKYADLLLLSFQGNDTYWRWLSEADVVDIKLWVAAVQETPRKKG